MPQEISVSYQAIKSKVYRLIDSLVVGEKERKGGRSSVRRWWALIHPADRADRTEISGLLVLGGLPLAWTTWETSRRQICEVARPQMTDVILPSKLCASWNGWLKHSSCSNCRSAAGRVGPRDKEFTFLHDCASILLGSIFKFHPYGMQYRISQRFIRFCNDRRQE